LHELGQTDKAREDLRAIREGPDRKESSAALSQRDEVQDDYEAEDDHRVSACYPHFLHDDVTYMYDDVTYMYDDVTYV